MNTCRLYCALGLAAILLGLAPKRATAQQNDAPRTRPNVVLIIGDDMAYTDYGFMGHAVIRTPRLDRLARESRLFRRGYVTTALCSPSLASILTGLYPREHRITGNDPPLPRGVKAAQAEASAEFLASRRAMIAAVEAAPMLPRLLGKQGYLSFQTGKWWLGSYRTGGFTQGMTSGDPAKHGRHGDEGLAIGRRGMAPIFEFIDSARKRQAPFFVWYAPMLPHSPHNPPERLLALYRDKAPTLEIAKYWAMCTWFDETCGALLDFLADRGLAKDTIVIYLADNGWIQDPDHDRYAPRSKQSPYEGGLRTPILVRWPGVTVPSSSEIPVSEIDIAPTILKQAGIAPDPRMRGVDLLDDKAVRARSAVAGELFTHNAVELENPLASLRFRWIVEGDWKLIVPQPPLEAGSPELYNLAGDPGETRNHALDEPARLKRLRLALDHTLPNPITDSPSSR